MPLLSSTLLCSYVFFLFLNFFLALNKIFCLLLQSCIIKYRLNVIITAKFRLPQLILKFLHSPSYTCNLCVNNNSREMILNIINQCSHMTHTVCGILYIHKIEKLLIEKKRNLRNNVPHNIHVQSFHLIHNTFSYHYHLVIQIKNPCHRL